MASVLIFIVTAERIIASAFIFIATAFVFIISAERIIAYAFIFIVTAKRIIASAFVFIETAERIIVTAERNRKTTLKKTFSSQNEGQPLTAVLRYCEKSAKLTFIFRKKLYFSRKYAVPKLATDAKRRNVMCKATSRFQNNLSSQDTVQLFSNKQKVFVIILNRK